MPKRINYVPNILNIKFSLILIIMICAIVFFIYLRKEYFNNNNNYDNNDYDIMDIMSKDKIRSNLEKVKKCIQNPDKCDREDKKDIMKNIDLLMTFL